MRIPAAEIAMRTMTPAGMLDVHAGEESANRLLIFDNLAIVWKYLRSASQYPIIAGRSFLHVSLGKPKFIGHARKDPQDLRNRRLRSAKNTCFPARFGCRNRVCFKFSTGRRRTCTSWQRCLDRADDIVSAKGAHL